MRRRSERENVISAAAQRKFISVEESFREWRKNPEYVAAYDALEDEFAVASALIKAGGDAEMTQEEDRRTR